VCPDPTALYMASAYRYWAAPNIPGAPKGAINFATNASSGTNSNQLTLRTDYSLSPHQQWFARYTLWKTNTLGTNYYHNNVPQPEVLSTSDQVVLGDTITLTPTTVSDVRASYLRFLFTSQPPDIGHVNLSSFGPAYGALQGQATFDVLPVPFLAGYGNPFSILIINVIRYYNYDTYLSANVSKTLGRNAIRFGGAARRVEAYLSGLTGLGPTGFFVFIPGVPTANEFANFMLGADIPIASNISTGRNTDSINFNQGYYLYDTFHANSRLTLTSGVRWELPGALSEKHDLNAVFLPALPSPLGAIQNPATSASQALIGNLALVHSSAYASRNDDVIHYHLFAPNLGFSFGILRSTVLRGGFGMSYVSLDAQIPSPSELAHHLAHHSSSRPAQQSLSADRWEAPPACGTRSRLFCRAAGPGRQQPCSRRKIPVCRAVEPQYPAPAVVHLGLSHRLSGLQRNAHRIKHQHQPASGLSSRSSCSPVHQPGEFRPLLNAG